MTTYSSFDPVKYKTGIIKRLFEWIFGQKLVEDFDGPKYFDALCERCGKKFGNHKGMECPEE